MAERGCGSARAKARETAAKRGRKDVEEFTPVELIPEDGVQPLRTPTSFGPSWLGKRRRVVQLGVRTQGSGRAPMKRFGEGSGGARARNMRLRLAAPTTLTDQEAFRGSSRWETVIVIVRVVLPVRVR